MGGGSCCLITHFEEVVGENPKWKLDEVHLYIYEYIFMSKINFLKSLLKNVIAVTITAPNLPLQMRITTYMLKYNCCG